MRSLHQKMSLIDGGQITQVFSGFLTGIDVLARSKEDRT
jgi:hypothetical protein